VKKKRITDGAFLGGPGFPPASKRKPLIYGLKKKRLGDGGGGNLEYQKKHQRRVEDSAFKGKRKDLPPPTSLKKKDWGQTEC